MTNLSAPNYGSSTSQPPCFRTEDLSLAAYLAASLGNVPRVVAIGPRSCAFEFPRSPEIEAQASSYTAGTALVDPAAYGAFRGTLRRQVDSVLNAKGGRS
jgi:hypothetical protein